MCSKRVLIVLFLFIDSWCFAIGAHPDSCISADKLIGRSWNIVLAKVVNADLSTNNWDVTYTFEVVETIRGNQKESFSILGRKIDWLTKSREICSYDEHTDSNFWARTVGRCPVYEGGAVKPSFNVGWTYLIFLDKPYHVRGFEVVHTTADKWYLYVKQRVRKQSEKESIIRFNSGLAQVAFNVFDVKKQHPNVDENQLTLLGAKYVRDNKQLTNQDIEEFIHNPNMIKKSIKYESDVLRGTEDSGGSESSNP